MVGLCSHIVPVPSFPSPVPVYRNVHTRTMVNFDLFLDRLYYFYINYYIPGVLMFGFTTPGFFPGDPWVSLPHGKQLIND